MKVYISDLEQDYEIRIYGVDRKEHTEEFITVVFGTGLKKLDEYEKQAYGSKADYAMSSRTLNAIAGVIDNIQSAIEEISADSKRSEEKYTYDSECYIF